MPHVGNYTIIDFIRRIFYILLNLHLVTSSC